MADVGDSSATEVQKTPTKGGDLPLAATDYGRGASPIGQVGSGDCQANDGSSTTGAKDNGKAVAPADANPETTDSTPSTSSTILSNQSFELWKAEAAQGSPVGDGTSKALELTSATLKANDGSAILSFNSEWFTDADVELAAKQTPTDGKPTKPGRPLDLSPPMPVDRPKTRTDKPPEIPPPPKRTPQLENGIPTIPTPEAPPGPKPAVPKVNLAFDASFLPHRIPAKADKQTVIVLDDYRFNNMTVNADKGFSHGELSARMAEENGFNVERVQIGRYENGRYNLPDAIASINKAIDGGTLKVEKGDIVNFSFDLAQTFASASRMLGIQITPENLREKRQEILDIMRVKSVDKVNTSKTDREFMRSVLAVDEGVRKLQEHGLIVVAAGGNAGKESFNLGFLSADKHYSALTPDGKKASYSADNSLTTPGLGEVNIYSLPLNAYDPTPFTLQKGTYRVGGTNIYLPASDFAGSLTPATLNPDVLRMMIDKTTISGGMTGFDRTNKPAQISRFEGSVFAPIDAKAAGLPIRPAELSDFNPDSWTLGSNVLNVKGTSFVNIFKLKDLQSQH